MDPSTLIPRLRRAGVDVNELLADSGGLQTTATPGGEDEPSC